MNELFQFRDQYQAISLQRDLAGRVSCVDDPGFNPRLVCGMDAAYRGEAAYVAATVWDLESKQFVEKLCKRDEAMTRYVPGLLGFREGLLLFRISQRLRSNPDVFLVDGQGVAHPRRFGLACHLGLAIEKPTVGVAKSRLYGKPENGAIVDPDSRRIGRIIATGDGRRFYVSVGHRISLDSASRLVEACIVEGHPAPLRQAHLDSETLKRNSV
jgi:deoxyribonuclease V